MSNRIKIKKQKPKEKEVEKVDHKDKKHANSFFKARQEKGTQKSNFSGKATKEYSRKKT